MDVYYIEITTRQFYFEIRNPEGAVTPLSVFDDPEQISFHVLCIGEVVEFFERTFPDAILQIKSSKP